MPIVVVIDDRVTNRNVLTRLATSVEEGVQVKAFASPPAALSWIEGTLPDLVITDLTRWEDWDSMPRLVKLFEEADSETSWVRVPVIHYLRACPLDEAKINLTKLK